MQRSSARVFRGTCRAADLRKHHTSNLLCTANVSATHRTTQYTHDTSHSHVPRLPMLTTVPPPESSRQLPGVHPISVSSPCCPRVPLRWMSPQIPSSLLSPRRQCVADRALGRHLLFGRHSVLLTGLLPLESRQSMSVPGLLLTWLWKAHLCLLRGAPWRHVASSGREGGWTDARVPVGWQQSCGPARRMPPFALQAPP